MRGGRRHPRHRLVGRRARLDQVEQLGAQPRVGDVLRGGRADARTGVCAAGGDGRAGRGHDDADHAGALAAPGQREGHSAAPGDDGRGVDLDHPLGPGQGGHHEAGRDREDALQPASHHAVDRLAVAHVGQVDDDLDDVRELAARLVQQHRDVGHRPLGLGLDVADPDRLARVQILADLAAQVDGVAGADGLAEVVVEVLLGVGVARVERPDPGVLHAAPTSSASTRSDSPAERCTNSSGPSKSNAR